MAEEGLIGARQCKHPTSAPDAGTMQNSEGQEKGEEREKKVERKEEEACKPCPSGRPQDAQ